MSIEQAAVAFVAATKQRAQARTRLSTLRRKYLEETGEFFDKDEGRGEEGYDEMMAAIKAREDANVDYRRAKSRLFRVCTAGVRVDAAALMREAAERLETLGGWEYRGDEVRDAWDEAERGSEPYDELPRRLRAAADGVEAPRKITSVAEFCAEAERIGLTASDLAEALSKRPEFADCPPSNAGVGVGADPVRAALEKLLRAEEKYVRDTGLPQPDDLIQNAVNEARAVLGWPAVGEAGPADQAIYRGIADGYYRDTAGVADGRGETFSGQTPMEDTSSGKTVGEDR